MQPTGSQLHYIQITILTHPGVSRIFGANIELKHVDVDIDYANKYSKRSGYVNINGNVINSSNGTFANFAKKDCYLYFPSINALVFIDDATGWINENNVKVKDFWRKSIDLGIHQNIKFYNFDFDNIHLTTDAFRALAEESLRLAEFYQLQRPYSWIQPGGYFPQVARNEIKEALGSELGFKAGGVFPDPSLKVFNEYNPKNDNRFGMNFGDFREDIWTLEQCKEFIANRVAKHSVVIGHSHFSVAIRRLEWLFSTNRSNN